KRQGLWESPNFVVLENKRLVPTNRPSETQANAIVLLFRPLCEFIAFTIGGVIQVPSVGIQVVVLMIPIGCAVIYIWAAEVAQSVFASAVMTEILVVFRDMNSQFVRDIDAHRNDRPRVRAAGNHVIRDVDSIQGNCVLIAARIRDGTS